MILQMREKYFSISSQWETEDKNLQSFLNNRNLKKSSKIYKNVGMFCKFVVYILIPIDCLLLIYHFLSKKK